MRRVPNRKYKTINGNYTENVCAMCFCKSHRGALTVEQLKKHKCLLRKCGALKKFDDHQFWMQRKNKLLRSKGLI